MAESYNTLAGLVQFNDRNLADLEVTDLLEDAVAIRRMADVFAGGSPLALIAQIVKSEKLSEKHIQELQEIVSETSNTKNDGKGETEQ